MRELLAEIDWIEFAFFTAVAFAGLTACIDAWRHNR